MKKTKAATTADDNDSSCLFSRLPDEIVLEILTRLIDLKTLCFCTLVDKRFYSIALQVDTISFTAPSDFVWDNFLGGKSKSLLFAFKSMKKFRRVKCLLIVLPSSCHGVDVDDGCLFRWKIKFGNRLDSFVFVSPDSVYETSSKRNVEAEVPLLYRKKSLLGYHCFFDARERYKMLLDFVADFPLLEKVSITDTGENGKVFLGGDKISELRNFLHSDFDFDDETVEENLRLPIRFNWCYIPLLELPILRYTMKKVFLLSREEEDLRDVGDDSFMNIDFEGNEGSAYKEAVMEIFNKHTDQIETT